MRRWLSSPPGQYDREAFRVGQRQLMTRLRAVGRALLGAYDAVPATPTAPPPPQSPPPIQQALPVVAPTSAPSVGPRNPYDPRVWSPQEVPALPGNAINSNLQPPPEPSPPPSVTSTAPQNQDSSGPLNQNQDSSGAEDVRRGPPEESPLEPPPSAPPISSPVLPTALASAPAPPPPPPRADSDFGPTAECDEDVETFQAVLKDAQAVQLEIMQQQYHGGFAATERSPRTGKRTEDMASNREVSSPSAPDSGIEELLAAQASFLAQLIEQPSKDATSMPPLQHSSSPALASTAQETRGVGAGVALESGSHPAPPTEVEELLAAQARFLELQGTPTAAPEASAARQGPTLTPQPPMEVPAQPPSCLPSRRSGGYAKVREEVRPLPAGAARRSPQSNAAPPRKAQCPSIYPSGMTLEAARAWHRQYTSALPPLRSATPLKSDSEQAVHLVSTIEDAEEAAEYIASYAETSCYIGLDLEWATGKQASMLQLAIPEHVFLFRLRQTDPDDRHIILEMPLPEKLQTVLSNPSILKVTVGIDEDRPRIKRQTDVEVAGLVDLYHLYLHIGYPLGTCTGLKALCASVCGDLLDKDRKVRCSNWDKAVLSDEQILYAVSDVRASFAVFEAVLRGFQLRTNSEILSFVQPLVDLRLRPEALQTSPSGIVPRRSIPLHLLLTRNAALRITDMVDRYCPALAPRLPELWDRYQRASRRQTLLHLVREKVLRKGGSEYHLLPQLGCAICEAAEKRPEGFAEVIRPLVPNTNTKGPAAAYGGPPAGGAAQSKERPTDSAAEKSTAPHKTVDGALPTEVEELIAAQQAYQQEDAEGSGGAPLERPLRGPPPKLPPTARRRSSRRPQPVSLPDDLFAPSVPKPAPVPVVPTTPSATPSINKVTNVQPLPAKELPVEQQLKDVLSATKRHPRCNPLPEKRATLGYSSPPPNPATKPNPEHEPMPTNMSVSDEVDKWCQEVLRSLG